MKPTCIDLAERFGSRYRIGFEQQAAEWSPAERCWLAYITCKYGRVGVQGGDRLYAFTNHRLVGCKLWALPFLLHAQGHAEVRAVFAIDHLPAVLAILKPYRRRQVSTAERARLAAVGAAHRFGKGPGHGVQSDFSAPGSTQHTGNRAEGSPGTVTPEV